jgi:hypothetical protein
MVRIPINGIGSMVYKSSAYARFIMDYPVTYKTESVLLRFDVEAYVVDNLKANILIGLDVLGRYDIVLHLGSPAYATVGDMHICILLTVTAKLNHIPLRPVYIISRIVVPPRNCI